jgi:hypothetical protein
MYSDTVLLGKDAVIGKVTASLTEVPFRVFRAEQPASCEPSKCPSGQADERYKTAGQDLLK